MRKQIILFFSCLLCAAGSLHTQVDAHFTQYYAYPLWLNPAFTGAIDGSWRVSGNYRKQWPSSVAAMTSQALSADVALPKNFGLGITVFSQRTGDGSYRYNTGYVSLSYQVHLSEYKILSAGFQAGLLKRRLDISKLQFGSQFNPMMGFDPSMPSNENLAAGSAVSFDGSVGLLYFDGNPNKNINPFIGVSLYHPSEPDNRFINNGESNRIPARYSVHGGLRLKMNDRFDLMPNLLYTAQASAYELAAGLSMNIRIDGSRDLVAGAMYRYKDAIAPNIGLYMNGLMIGFSYDINISQMKTVSSVNGGYELSISFTKPRKIPDTKFICPRL